MATSKIKPPLERQEGKKLIDWAQYHPRVKGHLIHIPNEGKRSVGFGYSLKCQGMMPGVSDYFLSIPSNGYAGFWIELKRISGSKTSLPQNEFIGRMRLAGYKAEFAMGADDAIEMIKKYLEEDCNL